MNLNQFTIKSQEAIQHAFQIAQGYSNQSIEPAHLLKAILEVEEDVSKFIFGKLGKMEEKGDGGNRNMGFGASPEKVSGKSERAKPQK